MTGNGKPDLLLESLLADTTLLADTSCPVVIHDLDGAVIEANQAFATLLGHTLADVHTMGAAQIMHPHDLAPSHADTADLIASRRPTVSAERRGLTKDGATVWVRVHKTMVHRHGREVIAVIIEDITDHRARVAELEHAAHHDELTGVLNRRGLLARLAGDEFVMLVPTDAATGVEDAVRAVVTTPTTLATDVTVVPSVAVGSAVLPALGSLASALHAADCAMYEDKRSRDGRGQPGPAAAATDYTQAAGVMLRRARTSLGLTLRQAHRRSAGRWTAAQLGSYERGEGSITVVTLVDLADFYGVTPAALLPDRVDRAG